MMYLFDTREKKNEHIKAYFEEHGIPFRVQKLDVADYQVEGKPAIAVDRKQNLDELAKNLTNRSDRSRFWKEVRRANQQGIKLFVLVEHSKNINGIEDVSKWNSYFSPVSGRSLMNEIYRVHIAYGVEFIFCDKKHTAEKIIEILERQ